jgi:glycosyltransferase involved in cell wall biosynthesis
MSTSSLETAPDWGLEPPSRAPAAPGLTVLIPAFNEREGVAGTIQEVRAALERTPYTCEIVVVDDGSTDGTGDCAEAAGARVLRQPSNEGYGSALKKGFAASTSELVAIIDADGTYPANVLPYLLECAADADMVVGARAAGDRSIPLRRRPAKWFLNHLASYLAGQKIPDVNSGLRILRRSAVKRFMAILPSGFSFTTTITLAMLCTNHRVAFVPIAYRRRTGSSKLRGFEFGNFLMLVVRTVVLFNPLKVFLPLGAVLFLAGTVKFVYDVFLWNLSESAVMAFLAAIIVWCVGLLADMIARLQLRPPEGP